MFSKNLPSPEIYPRIISNMGYTTGHDTTKFRGNSTIVNRVIIGQNCVPHSQFSLSRRRASTCRTGAPLNVDLPPQSTSSFSLGFLE